jgi:hypothetical protein
VISVVGRYDLVDHAEIPLVPDFLNPAADESFVFCRHSMSLLGGSLYVALRSIAMKNRLVRKTASEEACWP